MSSTTAGRLLVGIIVAVLIGAGFMAYHTRNDPAVMSPTYCGRTR